MSPNFKLHTNKFFLNQISTLTSIAYDSRDSSKRNGLLLATVLEKHGHLEKSMVTLTDLVGEVHTMMKNCPHKKPTEVEGGIHDGKGLPKKDPPDDNGDDDGTELGRQEERRRENTRYENNSGSVKLNILHNPTVHISTTNGVASDVDTKEVSDAQDVMFFWLCFFLFTYNPFF